MSITLRRFHREENIKVCAVFARALGELLKRTSGEPLVDLADPQEWQAFWEQRCDLFAHLSATGEGWLAEINHQIVGYARSVVRDDLRQLSEFFVLPDMQGQGVGSALLEHAFPHDENIRRLVVATTDASAVMRYTKSRVYNQTVVFEFEKTPQHRGLVRGLEVDVVIPTQHTFALLNDIDRDVLGHTREVDHRWLIQHREGFLYRRDGTLLGYGYVGEDSGPFCLLSPRDFPVVLDHAEDIAAQAGVEAFGLMVPLANHSVMDYVATRGYEMDYQFPMLCMTDETRLKFDRYVMSLPGFFI